MLIATFYIVLNKLSTIFKFNIITGYLLQGERYDPDTLPVGKPFRGKVRGLNGVHNEKA